MCGTTSKVIVERTVYTIIGILALVTLAAGFTEATLAVGHRGRLFDDRLVRPRTSVTPSPSPVAASPSPSPLEPSPIATPLATPVPTPVVPTATTNSFVRLRAGASTSSAVLAELNGGTVVTLGAYRDAQWQQVVYNGQNGYIFRSYLLY